MARKIEIMDANTAAAWTSYAFTEVAPIYPITPSSVMAELVDKWSAEGKKNIFGQNVKVVQMQSEAGVAGAMHGSLGAGALCTTYTASQGLLLMIPNMYKMAGELLPSVIHVSARTISSHALSIFGDHSDVMACRQTGYAMICSSSTQEVMDLSAAAHLSAIKASVPFLHFFDGFRTSHEINKIEVWDYDDLKEMMDMRAVENFRNHALNPNHPAMRGSAQNSDIFFQNKEASNIQYLKVLDIAEEYFDIINEKTGNNYKSVNFYGAEDATKVIVAMGSVCETIEETIDYLNSHNEKTALIKIHLYRPFPKEKFLATVPKSCEKIAVLDRCKEPGAIGEPLYLDVCAAFANEKNSPEIIGGRYGIASKDTLVQDIMAVYENLNKKEPIRGFTLSITDDVTNLSLKRKNYQPKSVSDKIECKFWGFGSDGTVGANKSTAKIVGGNTDLYVQAYFSYDSKKSGGLTVSHLRFSKEKIKSAYLIYAPDFVACHKSSYLGKYDMVSEIKSGGSFLINCAYDISELEKRLSAKERRHIAKNNIEIYTVDAKEIADRAGLGNKVALILQIAFFKITNIIEFEKAKECIKEYILKTFADKGEKIIDANLRSISECEKSIKLLSVPKHWSWAKDEENKEENLPEYVKNIMIPCEKQKGDDICVSAFLNMADGQMPCGTSAYEKRAVASNVPCWNKDKCIMCNKCAFICPHAVIRPAVLDENEQKCMPENMQTKDMQTNNGYKFSIVVSVYDCTGCANCVNICPAPNGGALEMKTFEKMKNYQRYFDFAQTLSEKSDLTNDKLTVKNSQFQKSFLEFSGACAGCGETPYAKLVTQICGDRAYISNATGCSSIWGCSAPSSAYCENNKRKGPAWASSLFEDNAEHGLGIALAAKHIRERLKGKLISVKDKRIDTARKNWLDTYDDVFENTKYTDELITVLKTINSLQSNEILKMKDFLSKKAVWLFGGDGWAYDIGYGGLDHVIASGEDVNILIFDTEVYSNTGGQASKATPKGACAKFTSSGKETKKKNLAFMAMSYGYVYVAQVSIGYDENQTLKAIKEAVSYNGPSVVICYSPCINHGIKSGMSNLKKVTEDAVKSGYWHTFRFNPNLQKPFVSDSKMPVSSYNEFIENEIRYSALMHRFPERARFLFEKAQQDAKEKYNQLEKLNLFFNE